MKKHLLALVICIALSLKSFAYDFAVNGIYYNVKSSTDKTASVTYGGSSNTSSSLYSGSITIPSSVYYNGTNYSVTDIGFDAFYNAYNVTRISLPSSIKTIQMQAFSGCSNLSTLTLPSSLQGIAERAFEKCTSLTSISIPASVTTIGMGAFAGCTNLTSISVASGNTKYSTQNGILYNYAKTSLIQCPSGYSSSSITVPSTVTYISGYAFDHCNNLTSITLPSGITTIYERTFQNCSKLTTINIPDGVKKIGSSAFSYCSSLQTISLPNSVTTLEAGAFEYCTSLSQFTMPNSVTNIGEAPGGVRKGVFTGCKKLSIVKNDKILAYVTSNMYGTYHIPDGIELIAHGALQYCSNITGIKVPASVKTIGQYAFANCGSLTSVEFSEDCYASLDSYIFSGSTKLTALSMPNTITSNAWSFDYNYSSQPNFNFTIIVKDLTYKNPTCSVCYTYQGFSWKYYMDGSEIESLDIPQDVTSIGEKLLFGCESIKELTIHENVTSINASAFDGCSNLENINVESKIPITISSNVFSRVPFSKAVLHVPAGTQNAYASATGWSQFVNIEDGGFQVNLIDGEPYEQIRTKDLDIITYTRNFTNTNWNALYVPFAMQYDDWAEDFEVARLNDVHQFDDDEDGEIDRTVLESVKLKAGSSIEPNTPYMIKAKEIGEKTITLTDATLYATAENSFDVTSWYTKFTFTGTYNTVTDMATAGHYALADGGLKQASSDAVTLGAFRWYLDITDRNGAPAQIKGRKVLLSFDDGETTEISVVPADAASNSSEIFTLSGAKVGNDKASLSKGLYISNGKKILVK